MEEQTVKHGAWEAEARLLIQDLPRVRSETMSQKYEDMAQSLNCLLCNHEALSSVSDIRVQNSWD